MHIQMTVAEAESLIATRYPGLSKPLTKFPKHAPQSLDAWLTARKRERGYMPRKYAAVPFYIYLAEHAIDALPPRVFPAVFNFEDGTRLPDKGLIKALFYNGSLCCRHVGELAFGLTEEGQRRFFGD
ncbi:hypothetical protein [Kordiimonas sp.]|uniref:hypothetical protein n=1 Tax=Kordiimonas sp. TaxID=1970157 RepID=UPI003A8F3090